MRAMGFQQETAELDKLANAVRTAFGAHQNFSSRNVRELNSVECVLANGRHELPNPLLESGTAECKFLHRCHNLYLRLLDPGDAQDFSSSSLAFAASFDRCRHFGEDGQILSLRREPNAVASFHSHDSAPLVLRSPIASKSQSHSCYAIRTKSVVRFGARITPSRRIRGPSRFSARTNNR